MYQADSPELLIIEQPEDSLHPAAMGVIIEALRSAPRVNQVILTTHSPEVLDYLDPNSDKLMVMATSQASATLLYPEPGLIQGVKDHLCLGGDLLRMRVLEGESDFSAQAEEVSPEELHEQFFETIA
jgi:AAA15 family ATPase/GTPase